MAKYVRPETEELIVSQGQYFLFWPYKIMFEFLSLSLSLSLFFLSRKQNYSSFIYYS